MKKRVHNFSAGPAILPEEVLAEIKEEFNGYQDIGSTIIEISHRDKTFLDIAENAESSVRRLLNLGDDYKVLFMQGGATLQFSLIPLNFAHKNARASYAEIGSWSSKAAKEASKVCDLEICHSSKENGFNNIEDLSDWVISNNSKFVHYCKNETIQGIRIPYDPNFQLPTFVDMSSCLFSEDIDVTKYDFIYACAQKNFGPSGITLIILRKTLLEKCDQSLPNILRYDMHAQENSMLNTPNTFAWYVAGKMFNWYEKNGGVKEMEKKSIEKSQILYDLIDLGEFYQNPVLKSQRSINNVVFTIKDSNLEQLFLDKAKKYDLHYLKGHRSVGGMRASIYNSMSKESVVALRDFMQDFEKQHG
ncbi:MAG: 3-phosphoserine/phosphohydroxythreonine transaminase [Proteobacteria bacterium]|nr:3-phosphoserine/phosphohydroxythreonine transaminase [SAR86 cluster bacterium]MDA0344803.1 3-phosphoserine/phosphohydroxythreonine transaminase [Pseudomonadota bacterium]MDA0900050.1 3-phosphoserine/phosphohydroxythreonine transaminase [Pseudomonadota bacterium]